MGGKTRLAHGPASARAAPSSLGAPADADTGPHRTTRPVRCGPTSPAERLTAMRARVAYHADVQHRVNVARAAARALHRRNPQWAEDELLSAGLVALARDRGPTRGLWRRVTADMIDAARDWPGPQSRATTRRGATVAPADWIGTRDMALEDLPGRLDAEDRAATVLDVADRLPHGLIVCAGLAQGLTLAEIGAAAGVSESRVWQIARRIRRATSPR